MFESKILLGKDFGAVKAETERWPFKVVLSDDGVKPAVEGESHSGLDVP